MKQLTVMEMAAMALSDGHARCFDVASEPRVAIVASPVFDRLPCEAIRVALDAVPDSSQLPKLDPNDPLQMTIEQAVVAGRRHIVFVIGDEAADGAAVVAIGLDGESSGRLVKLMEQCQVEIESSD